MCAVAAVVEADKVVALAAEERGVASVCSPAQATRLHKVVADTKRPNFVARSRVPTYPQVVVVEEVKLDVATLPPPVRTRVREGFWPNHLHLSENAHVEQRRHVH
eukprot:6626767-Prymnesium_polylepis.2